MTSHTSIRAARIVAALWLSAALGCGGDEGSAQGPTDPGNSGSGDRVPSAFVGTWVSGNVSPVGFYSPSSGSWGAPSGVGMFYKFQPNGQFERGVLLQSTLYNCTMSVLGYKRGTIEVDGSTFELRSTTHKMKSVDNCVQKNNYEKTLENDAETLILELGTDDYGNRALWIRSPGVGASRFYPSRN